MQRQYPGITSSAVIRIIINLPDKLNGKGKWESPADTSGMLLTGLFLIAAMAILVMKGREEQVQLTETV